MSGYTRGLITGYAAAPGDSFEFDAMAYCEAVIPPAASTRVSVECPDGVGPGQLLLITAPSGKEMEVPVPEGVSAGDVFEVDVATDQDEVSDTARGQAQGVDGEEEREQRASSDVGSDSGQAAMSRQSTPSPIPEADLTQTPSQSSSTAHGMPHDMCPSAPCFSPLPIPSRSETAVWCHFPFLGEVND